MPIQSMQCPRCGHWATEYDEDKWQCLSCHNKFIYEPRREDAQSPKSDIVVQHTFDMTEEGLLYACTACGLRFSLLTKPDQHCITCGASLCPDCFNSNNQLCSACLTKARRLRFALGCAVLALAAFATLCAYFMLGDQFGNTASVLAGALLWLGILIAAFRRRK